MRNRSLFVASWVLLVLLTGLLMFGSVGSAMNALGGAPDSLTPSYAVDQLAAADADAATAVRGRRATAATWALAYGLILLYVILVPYRRAERWAWFAIAVSLGISQAISLLRIVALGTTQGALVPTVLLGVVALALLLGAPRMFARSEPLAAAD